MPRHATPRHATPSHHNIRHHRYRYDASHANPLRGDLQAGAFTEPGLFVMDVAFTGVSQVSAFSDSTDQVFISAMGHSSAHRYQATKRNHEAPYIAQIEAAHNSAGLHYWTVDTTDRLVKPMTPAECDGVIPDPLLSTTFTPTVPSRRVSVLALALTLTLTITPLPPFTLTLTLTLTLTHTLTLTSALTLGLRFRDPAQGYLRGRSCTVAWRWLWCHVLP